MTRHTIRLILIALFAVACAKKEAPEQPVQFSSSAPRPAAAQPAPTAPAAPATAAAGSILVTSADGSKSWTIVADSAHVDVSVAGGERYIGDQSGEKRRYRRASTGAAFVEVKTSDNGFKVRTPDSRLLWKVKLDDDKIKVSDNEENRNPWVLKTKYDDKAKVLDPAEKEIGEVRFYKDSGKVKVKDAAGTERFTSATTKASASFGVLLMSGVPEEYRAIIMAEILARGR